MKTKLSLVVCLVVLFLIVIGSGCAVLDSDTRQVMAQKPLATASTPTPTPKPTPTPTPMYEVNMAAVGDLMCHQEQIDAAYVDDGVYDFEPVYASVTSYLTTPDYTVGNLETTLAGAEIGYSGYPVFNAPDEFALTLQRNGFDFFSTANNHCNDKHEIGILNTTEKLDRWGIDHAGTYASEAKSDEIFITEINNITFAFLSYTYGTNGISVPEDKPYLVNLLDEQKVTADIIKAKALDPDFIVVLPHMGNEYEKYPQEQFKNWAQLMFESGADIVLASHPHVLQPMEFIEITDADGSKRTCFVAYSLGNFISSQRTPPRDTGIVLNLHFSKKGEEKAVLNSVSYMPTWVRFTNSSGERAIKIFSIYDVLKAIENGQDPGLREKDINRIKAAHQEVATTMLGKEVPLSYIQNEYYIFP